MLRNSVFIATIESPMEVGTFCFGSASSWLIVSCGSEAIANILMQWFRKGDQFFQLSIERDRIQSNSVSGSEERQDIMYAKWNRKRRDFLDSTCQEEARKCLRDSTSGSSIKAH